ncbi:MAG: hypothetical protein R3B91_22355 [Planctomycetaceae bacterium]
MRVLDGLEGASANAGMQFDRSRMEQILSGVGSRVFLLNNVHEDEPVVFQTLGSVLSQRSDDSRADREADGGSQAGDFARTRLADRDCCRRSGRPVDPAAAASVNPGLETRPPVLSSKIDQLYLPVDRAVPREAPIRYEPALVGYGGVHFDDSKSNVSESRTVFRFVRADSRMRANPWPDAESLALTANELDRNPLPEAEGPVRVAQ